MTNIFISFVGFVSLITLQGKKPCMKTEGRDKQLYQEAVGRIPVKSIAPPDGEDKARPALGERQRALSGPRAPSE
ncbi:hypothetical protein MHYP_G00124510 [Metynnis hypsauchen]